MNPRFVSSLALSLIVLSLAGCVAPPVEEVAELPTIDLSGGPAFPLEAHLESEEIAAGSMTYAELFEAGDELFHTPYNGYDGIGGAVLPDGTPLNRFSNVPPGGGHFAPINSQSCGSCHIGAASGLAHTQGAFDFDRDGKPPFHIRSTTSLFGNGLLQLLAQEMTEELHAAREAAGEAARSAPGEAIERQLTAKGVDFGTVTATADGDGEVSYDVSGRRGVDPDLVVRPLGWKGNITMVRTITAGPAAGVMGLQPEEIVLKGQGDGEPNMDPDGDGVERELSIGDITAMVVYGSAQETPQSVERLAELGFVQAPSAEEVATIGRGREAFDAVGCATCHTPEMRLENTVFEEPTRRGNGNYYDPVLAELDSGYDLDRPVTFDMLQDAEEPRVEAHPNGGAVVRLYGDLKRHHMGRHLADPTPQPPLGANGGPVMDGEQMVLIQATEFLTAELWGVGNTGPWMHDGRAGSLAEAVLQHGEDDPPPPGDPGRSEAQEARDAFAALGAEEQEALLMFLRNLRTFHSPRN